MVNIESSQSSRGPGEQTKHPCERERKESVSICMYVCMYVEEELGREHAQHGRRKEEGGIATGRRERDNDMIEIHGRSPRVA